MQIGQLASRAGVGVETIRFWEREGLLRPPGRSSANYRVYNRQHLADVAFVRFCRDLGLPLAQIKPLLDLRRTPQQPCAAVNALLDQHLAELQRRIAELQALQTELQRLKLQCDGSHTVEACGILKHMDSTAAP